MWRGRSRRRREQWAQSQSCTDPIRRTILSLFLENGFDYVLCGEAEESLVRLCRSILDAEEVPEIDGMVRLDEHGCLVRSSQRLSKNPAWSELPLPARDLIDMEPYRKAWVNAHGYFSANMVSSRGCPYSCNWCAKPISGNKFHLRSGSSRCRRNEIVEGVCGGPAYLVWR